MANASGKRLVEMDAKPEVLSQHGPTVGGFICHAHISHGQQASSLWWNPRIWEDNVQPGPASSDHAWFLSSNAVVDDWFSMWSAG